MGFPYFSPARNVSADSDAPLSHHILKVFSPECVCGYRCDRCQVQSSAECPATRRGFLLSLPRFLRVNVTAPLASGALPMDFHQHGPLKEYDRLNLSQVAPQQAQSYYILRAAIMYSKRHHWVYLHGESPTLVSDETSRVATPDDIRGVARCARILIYEIQPAPVLKTAAATPIRSAEPAPTCKEYATAYPVKPTPTCQDGTCAAPAETAAVKVERKQSENSVDAVPRMGIHQQQQQQPQQQQRKQQRKQRECPQQQQQQPLLCKNAGVHHQDGDRQSVTHVGGRVGPLQRATAVIIRPSDAQRTNPGLKQRLLSDFLPVTLRPQDVRPSLPAPRSVNLLQTTQVFAGQPDQQKADSEWGGRDRCPSSQTSEQQSICCNGTQTHHSPQRSPGVPMLATAASERLPLDHPGLSMPVQTVQSSPCDDRTIIVKGAVPGATPWKPGTAGLYPRPRGAHRSNTQATAFPVWNTRMKGKGWQQAMFHAADSIEQNGITAGARA